jgi:hypothetical protein
MAAASAATERGPPPQVSPRPDAPRRAGRGCSRKQSPQVAAANLTNLETSSLNGRRVAGGTCSCCPIGGLDCRRNRPLFTVLVTFNVEIPFRLRRRGPLLAATESRLHGWSWFDAEIKEAARKRPHAVRPWLLAGLGDGEEARLQAIPPITVAESRPRLRRR